MEKRVTFQALASLAIFGCCSAAAQADIYDFDSVGRRNHAETVLPLDQALREAAQNNAMLQAVSADADAKSARVGPSGALDDPAIEASFSNYPVSSFSTSESSMTGNEVMLLQKFPYPGKRAHLKMIAEHEAQAGKERVEGSKLEIGTAVQTGYYKLFLSYKREEILGNRHKLLRNLESVARNRFSLGLTPQTEVLELQLQATELLVKLQEEEREIAAQRAELNHLLGRTGHDSEWKPQPLKETAVNLKEILDRSDEAFDANPTVRVLRAEVQAFKAKSEYNRLNDYPDFEVGVGYMQRFSNRDDNGEDFISARVGITLPFLQGGKQRDKLAEAEAEGRKAQALLHEQQFEISHKIHQALAELNEASNKLTLYRKGILPLSDAAISAALKSYEGNQGSYLSALNLISSRFEAENGYYEALVQHESTLAAIEALIGAPVARPSTGRTK